MEKKTCRLNLSIIFNNFLSFVVTSTDDCPVQRVIARIGAYQVRQAASMPYCTKPKVWFRNHYVTVHDVSSIVHKVMDHYV